MSKISYGNLTIPVTTTAAGAVYTINAGGGGGSGATYAYNNSWTSPANSGTIKIAGDAEITGKIMLQGQDLGRTIEQINQRLAILVPDPKLLDKYNALKEAYDHYKTLEALCIESDADRTEK
jgi:hypothetical protein